MSIPKIIYQTYKSNNLPFFTKVMVSWIKRLNPNYRYEFFDDDRIFSFIKNHYPTSVLKAYSKLDIGAAKADFFRYLALYETGGIYMDMDAYVTKSFDKFIMHTDKALITKERNEGIFAQYALVFEARHPILEKCIDTICHHIENKMHVNDIHQLTGPSVFTNAVNWYLKLYPDDENTRMFGIDYKGYIKPKYWLHSGLFVKREKWQTAQERRPAIKE